MKRARPWKVPACYDGTHGGRTRCAVRTGAALLLLCVLGVRGMGENKKERWSERTKEE